VTMRSYGDVSIWDQVASLLPERNRISSDAKPDATFWDWKGHRIHTDQYTHPAAEAKIILLHGIGGNGRLLSFIPSGWSCWLELVISWSHRRGSNNLKLMWLGLLVRPWLVIFAASRGPERPQARTASFHLREQSKLTHWLTGGER